MSSIEQEFIYLCSENDLEKAKEIYNNNKEQIIINKIIHDTKTSDVQGPYSLFECMCIKNYINIIKWFIELGVEDTHYKNGFISSCQYNHIELVKFLFDYKNDIQLDYQTSFIVCCHTGNIEIVKWLYTNANNHIDIHINDETPFLYAIAEGHFELAKWLYHISISEKIINIHADNNYAFIYACYLGRLDICEWLYLISNHTIDKKMDNCAPLKSAKLSGNIDLINWLGN
jgi:ankyrin repeat protein